MKARKVLARVAGTLYILLGVVNLLGLLAPEIREQIISLGAVLFRYSGFILVGIGLLFLQKWSAYLWGALLLANVVIVYTVYGGQFLNLSGVLSVLAWVGPALIIGLFYYLWPVLKLNKLPASSNA